ncbi:PDR/VanB family oxidoreductase, partial [Acinetobacter gerneri]|uniref:PDR/VanB family oxidoreductase n=1 Tax=Acinetobacter gerneri TaxID=202952 RepID=UPI003AF7EDDF
MTIAVKKDPNSRGGSRSVHEDLRLGSVIEVSEPRSHFKISAAESHHILIAAGIGITPLLSMTYECLRLGKTFELHYFSRSLESTAFRERLMQEDFANRVSFYHEADREKIEKLIETAVSSDQAAHVYTCGPGEFMDKVISIASKTRPSNHIHKEAFGVQSPAVECSNEPFTLRLAQSEITLEVGAAESIVDALAKCGIVIPTSCGEGVCRTCLIPVSCGKIDHRDNLLTDDEKAQGDMMCACVSRAKEGILT